MSGEEITPFFVGSGRVKESDLIDTLLQKGARTQRELNLLLTSFTEGKQTAIYFREVGVDDSTQLLRAVGFENFNSYTPEGKSLKTFLEKIQNDSEREQLLEALTNHESYSEEQPGNGKVKSKRRELVVTINENGAERFIRWKEYRYRDEDATVYAVGMLEDCTDEILEKRELEDLRRKEHERVIYEANHDSLTGLFSRRAYDEAMKIIQSSTDSTAFLLIDLNDLHELNLSFSDKGGDKVLVRVADELVSLIGIDPDKLLPGAGIYRIGGDEFVVILRNFPQEGMDSLMKRLRERFRHENQTEYNAKAGLSIGGVFIPEGGNEDALNIRKHVFELADEVVFNLKLNAHRFHHIEKDWKVTEAAMYDAEHDGSIDEIIARQEERPTRKVR